MRHRTWRDMDRDDHSEARWFYARTPRARALPCARRIARLPPPPHTITRRHPAARVLAQVSNTAATTADEPPTPSAALARNMVEIALDSPNCKPVTPAEEKEEMDTASPANKMKGDAKASSERRRPRRLQWRWRGPRPCRRKRPQWKKRRRTQRLSWARSAPPRPRRSQPRPPNRRRRRQPPSPRTTATATSRRPPRSPELVRGRRA
mmetsp:Transcript_25522/g.85042  ORF Transcript_25522/g.85042 Transcript_25522/m.85042 type:complete len:207 (+) Transcript_25522:71-691(+)